MIGTQLIEVDERAPSLRWMLRATIRSARPSGVLRLSITGKHAVDKSAQIPPADVDVLARNRCTNTGQHNPFHPGSVGVTGSSPTASGPQRIQLASPRFDWAYAFALMFCGSRRHTNAGTNWGPHALRDGERSARLCTSSTAPPRPHTPGDQRKRVTVIYSGSSGGKRRRSAQAAGSRTPSRPGFSPPAGEWGHRASRSQGPQRSSRHLGAGPG
jgi:hypothetical protein